MARYGRFGFWALVSRNLSPNWDIDANTGQAQIESRVQILKRVLCSNNPVISLNKPASGAIRKTPRISAEVGGADLVGSIVPDQLRRS